MDYGTSPNPPGGQKMITIKVKEKDMDKVFAILSGNGRFTGLSDNQFRLDENADEVLKKIEEEGIVVEIIKE